MKSQKYNFIELIQYIKPIWYFSLKPYNKNNIVWVEYDNLTVDQKKIISFDKNYSHIMVSKWDASYQALMKGIVHNSKQALEDFEVNFTAADIYRFTRKYFNQKWIYFILLYRIICLNNPIKELLSYYNTRNIKKINLFRRCYKFDDYACFKSSLIKRKPLVSIILPTLNRYQILGDLLQDLERQTYSNFELIIIDQSLPFDKAFYDRFNIKFHIIKQNEKALWKARNQGIKLSNSNFLLFLDDDSRIKSNWIIEHLKCVDYFKTDISSGISKSIIGAKIPLNYNFFRYSDQIDTGNVLIKKKVFKKCGLFDQQFEKMRLGDGEFGARCYLYGFNNISNPMAYRKHLKASLGGLRTFGHWDAFRSLSLFAPRPVPSVLYFYRKYWGNKAAVYALLITLPLTFSPYRLKTKKLGYLLSIIMFSIFFPLVIIKVLISWKISEKMLKKGPIIEDL